jgi:hypothetical protein
MAFDDPWIATVLRHGLPEESIVAWTSATVPGASIQAPSRPSERVHCAQYLLGTLTSLGCDSVLDTSPLRVTPIASDEVLVHPGSGSVSKNWPAQCFAEVIRAVDAPVQLIVGEADGSVVAEIEKMVGCRLPHLETDLGEVAARLAGCAAYLGNDSGVSHLAGLCGARTVAMFGPSDPTIWRPLGPRVTVLPFEADADEVVRALTSQ